MALAEVGRAGIVQNLCSRHGDFTGGREGADLRIQPG